MSMTDTALRELREAFGVLGTSSQEAVVPPPPSHASQPDDNLDYQLRRIFDRIEFLVDMQDRRYMKHYILIRQEVFDPLDVPPHYMSWQLVLTVCRQVIQQSCLRERFDIRSINKYL